MDGSEFAHIEVIPIPDTGRPPRKCFVGHRFSRSVEKTLRWNLRQVLEPYNVAGLLTEPDVDPAAGLAIQVIVVNCFGVKLFGA